MISACCCRGQHFRLVVLRFVLLAATASGFLFGGSSSVNNRAFASKSMSNTRPSKRVSAAGTCSSSDDHSRTTRLAALAANGEDRRKNIFHDYDGPIVLLGCSSTSGNELLRLAESFSTTAAAAAQKKESEIVQLSVENKDSLLESVSNKQYGWPDILVLDATNAPLRVARAISVGTMVN